MPERTAILVTGMHRSGTSALARTLSILGAGLPDDLVPANEGNPDGHWEPRAVVELNDRMLADAGSDLYGVVDIAPAWFESARVDRFVDEARHVIERAFGGDDLVVSKDPRTALMLPIWDRAFAEAGYRVVHVLPLRRPEDVAASLRRRHLKTIPYDAWPRPRGETLWLRYSLAAVRGSRGRPRAFVEYADLLADWRREVDRIGRDLAIVWPRLATQADREVDAFLHDNSFVHDDKPPTAAGTPPSLEALAELDLPGLATALYELLSRDGDVEPLVDAIQAHYTLRIAGCRDLLLAFEGLYPLVWRYFEESRDSAHRLAQADSRERQLRHAVQHLWGNLTRANDDKTVLRQDLSTKIEQVASTESSVEQIGQALVRANAQRDDYADAVEKIGRALVDANRQRDDYADAVEKIGQALVDANRQRDDVVAERDRLVRTVEEVREAVRRMTDEHASRGIRLNEIEAERDHLARQKAVLQAKIEETAQDRAIESNVQEQLRSDVIRLEAQKDRCLTERDRLVAALDAQKSAIEQLRADHATTLDRLHSSLSWTITAPLRVFARLLGPRL